MILLDTGMRNMPDKCSSCRFFCAESPMYCTAVVGATTVSKPYERRPVWCPLNEVEADSDTISRQDAIEHLKKRLYESALNNDGIASYTFEEIADNRIQIWMDELPPSPSRPQWIPVTERLPEHSCQTLVTTKWDTEYSVEYGFYWKEDNKWGTITNNVIAWMPLPEPYHNS